jgi:hypothetical protein
MIKHNSHIDFLPVARIEGMHFDPHRPNGIEFSVHGDAELRFFLAPSKPEQDACGHREGLECKTYTTHAASEEQALFVDAYNNHNTMLRVAEGLRLPFAPDGKPLIHAGGKFEKGYHPGRYVCPADIRALVERFEFELANHTDRFLKLLRWRQGIDAAKP